MSENDFWVNHSSGAWAIRRGNELGHTLIKTSAMGLSEGSGWRPLRDGDPAIVARLVAANKKQLGEPQTKEKP